MNERPELRRLSARIFNTPLMATPEAAEAVANVLLAREGGVSALTISGSPDDDDDGAYAVVDGVAVIAVHGELVNRGSWLNSLSGMTSYEALAKALSAAVADPNVSAILLDIDSPGGEAAGAMETAAKVRAANERKPVTAYVNSLAASAAYALAAGAGEIVTPPSGSLGSIGVVMLHLDRSGAMASRGVKPTLIHAGAYKVDGNSLGPLPDDVRGRLQAQIDDVYGLFAESVGAHRPKLGADGARKTEAGMFMGAKAVEAGLADRVGDLEGAIASLKARGARAQFFASTEPQPEAQQPEADMADETALASARNEAIAADRARSKAILTHAAAKGREPLAQHLAYETDMSAEAAIAVLALAPAAAPAPAASRIDSLRPAKLEAEPTQGSGDTQASIDASYAALVADLNKQARRH